METSATIIVVVSFLAILLNVVHVESKPSGEHHMYILFVFGDSYADTGNIPKNDLSSTSRQWYPPYGVSTMYGEPSGRFSDGSLETDFIATMIGRVVVPSTYRDWRAGPNFGMADLNGMNFAHGGAGVYKAPSLSKQIRYLERLIDEGQYEPWQLKESVALVAISGNDYYANMSRVEDMTTIIGKVTTEIAKGVKRLHKMGVTMVLVNNLHPAGCTPRQTRALNYTRCDGNGNTVAESHNRELTKKLNIAEDTDDSVYVVDLNRAFSSIINPQDPSTSSQRAKEFTHKLKPCCRSSDPNGYCGQVDEDDKPQYSVCKNPQQHFFWDDMHPSEAGWDAIMEQLESDIKDFLDISH
ncbi:hypothetical protein EJB05_18316 [Eragrostis curvula]|uniref:SGNH hydrolase-type esterase domain-containing protein n=1 Tax=Eragrostis curvula TaxID=38414 RepID=A0A5J9VJN9_9POAL|nr:hypothetical protein EJB05_18316 [Eragrostis curvula]